MELASTLSAAGVTHIAIEKDNFFWRVEYSEDYGATWHQPSGGVGGQAILDEDTPYALIGLAAAGYHAVTPAAFAVPMVRICGPIGE